MQAFRNTESQKSLKKAPLKKVEEQVIVITGATSGIGLATARRAAERGARLVLAARNAEALDSIVQELSRAGHEALAVAADVGDREQVERIAQAAIARFGGFDTWVNNAGVSIYGKAEDVPVEDQRRLFDTNYWGVVHGSLAAVAHLKERGGTLINIGSEVSDAPVPLQSAYSASKHAVRGFTDALRTELEHDSAPVRVTLIKPAAVDTMFIEHSKNYMDVEPRLPSPIYPPEVVADAILFAAEHPKRDIFIGSAAKAISMSARYAPRLTDKLMQAMFKSQRSDKPARDRSRNSLYAPQQDLQERGQRDTSVRSTSLYTAASTHPKTTGMVLLGVGLALAALMQVRRTGPARPFRLG
jgi:short-subunit dehydrogenase